MRTLRVLLRTLFNLALFPLGVLHYLRSGQTPPWAHQALVQLFCVSGGRFNDALSACVGLWAKRLTIPAPKGVLGDLRGVSFNLALGQLREKGYLVLPSALPQEVCDRLMQYALNAPATPRRMDRERLGTTPSPLLFDSRHPLAVRYDYPVEGLLNNEDIQNLLADSSILALAQAYLGARPRADVLSMWWHTNYQSQPDSEAAQFFHFDLDRIRWLKIFIYLTDVGPDDGPHTFVEGSHRTGSIPSHFLGRGYVRYSDDEVLSHYGGARLIEFSAPRGSIIIEDTRGLHKGKAVSGSSRLILQLQFSNSLFGAAYAKAAIRLVSSDLLRQGIAASPDVYAQYLRS